MAWNQTTTSFQKSKRQQNSLQTDSSLESFESSSSGAQKSSKTCLMNYENLAQRSSDSDPGLYLSKNFKPSKTSENNVFDFELSPTTKNLKSPSHRHFYQESTTTDSASNTLMSPIKKHEYNVVSSSTKSEISAGKLLLHLR